MSTLRQTLKSALMATLPKSRLLVRGPRRAASAVPAEIALTFDDGPHPEHTPRVLDALAEAGFRATFFVIGEKAERHPDLIRRIVAEGHLLGTHTWTHSEPARTSTSQLLAETEQTRRLLEDVSGVHCRLMRPPKGELTLSKIVGLWRSRQTIVLWNIDPKDFAMRDPSDMPRWCDSFSPRSGDIVLLHDNHPHAAFCVQHLSQAPAKAVSVSVSNWLTSV